MTTIAPMEKRLTVTTVAGRAAPGEAEMTISTASLDREHDELVPEGCELGNYQRNPVVLFGHDHYDLPVGLCTAIDIEPTGIRAAWRWLQDDARADRVRNAYEQGVLRAASVGFRPLAYEPNAHGGYKFTRWELLEWSLVPIPANPDAVRTLKSLGLHGPSAVTHLALTLQQLTSELKTGRVLSAANETRLRDAAALIRDVLAQLDEDDPDEKDVALHVLVNGQRIAISPDALRVAVAEGITGRSAEEPVVHVDEDILTALIKQRVQNELMQITGRLD